jgi:cbb3-type cytochrome oxidase subunit 3
VIQEMLTRSANSLWPIISLIIFVICFVGVLIWTYRGGKDRFRRERNLPLDDSSSLENSNGAKHGQ